jgi:hypothetical protein
MCSVKKKGGGVCKLKCMQFYCKKWAGIAIGNNCCVKKMTENHQKLYEPATVHTYSVYIMSVINFFFNSPDPKGHVRYNR